LIETNQNYQNTNRSTDSGNEFICGNGICEIVEDCNSCPSDCKCKEDEYCNEIGICAKKELCGDGRCTEMENSTSSCCEDCGCSETEICNEYTHKCQLKANISEERVKEIVSEYLNSHNISGKIIYIEDTYYKTESVKAVSIDCRKENEEFFCNIILLIDENGNILKEYIL